MEAWKFFFPEESERENKQEEKEKKERKGGEPSFLNWEIILVATERRWEVRTSFDNYKISSLWLDIIDDYTVANSRPASLRSWDISFLRCFQAVKASPVWGVAHKISGSLTEMPVLCWIKRVH